MRIQVIPYTGILYYKVYNSSCSQVRQDLIDRLQSLPEQIKVTAYICKHILCDDGSASSSDAVNTVYQIMSYLTVVLVAYLVLNIEYGMTRIRVWHLWPETLKLKMDISK